MSSFTPDWTGEPDFSSLCVYASATFKVFSKVSVAIQLD